jgi:cation diffusion facilitator family transporter
MDQCCAVREVPRGQRRVLCVVLGINAAMFLVEFGAGLHARSTALLADSVDMLGDALVYGFSLHVAARGAIWQARAAMVKGVVMAGFGVGVLVEVVVKVMRGTVPVAEVMAPIGAVALAANTACLWLLWRRRAEDINMRSAWLCSRNDVAANVGVLLAAVGVATTGVGWPDIAVGLAIASLFAGSAVGVLREAGRALRPGVHAH